MLACMATYSLDDVREVCKKRDAWWTVLLVDPVAVRLTRLLANWTPITPNQLTLASLAAGLGAAGCFATGTPYWLALGALVYHVSFILGCCDGKLARLKGTGTPLGPWLNQLVDRTRVLCCALALIGGQYLRTGRVELFYVGFTVVVLEMFRSLNTFHAARTRQAIRDRLDIAAELAGAAEPTESAGPLLPRQDERLRYVEDLYGHSADPEARSRGGAGRIDPARHRDRSAWGWERRPAPQGRCERIQVVSGVEFQAALFVVAPTIGMIVPIAMAAAGLLLVFELVAIYRIWMSTHECEELIEELLEDAPSGRRGLATGLATGSPSRARPLSDAGAR
jgi:phosphatidylglycerophosphate synthase